MFFSWMKKIICTAKNGPKKPGFKAEPKPSLADLCIQHRLKGCAKQNNLLVATPDKGLLGIVVEHIFGHAEALVFVDSFVES